MKPTVGRIVHYVNENGEHCAAIVAKVWSDTCVNLTLFTPNGGTESRTSASYDELPRSYSWHWPERD